MKKWIFILLLEFFLVGSCVARAQTVGYTYKALAAEGCSMKYSVAKQNDKYYIVATVSSDRMKFLKNSIMMVRTTDGEVLRFSGELIDNGTESAGIVSGNMVIPVTAIISTAHFEVAPEQFELLKKGVVKVRLTTTPIEHEREFKKDKIGKQLYEFFVQAKNREDDF